MNWWQAIILGIVEGVTEFLPVSSTGHLLLVQRLLGIERDAAADAYAIVIQAGAIVAAAGLYRQRVGQMMRGLMGKDAQGHRLAINLLVAFAITAIFALTLEHTVKNYLFGVRAIAAAWVIGGGAILIYTTLRPHRAGRSDVGLSLMQLTPASAVFIGLFQAVAMWPGTSRSLVTILAGLLVGMSLASAVEFSFLLGTLTLLAATAKDIKTHGGTMLSEYSVSTMVIGMLAASVSAFLAIRWMVTYLKRHSLALFGWYRVGLGVLVIALIALRWV